MSVIRGRGSDGKAKALAVNALGQLVAGQNLAQAARLSLLVEWFEEPIE